MISVSSLLNGNFDDYSKLFIEIPLLTYQKGLHMSPGGRYLRAFTRVTWTESILFGFRLYFYFDFYFCIRLLNDKFLKFLISNSCLMVSLPYLKQIPPRLSENCINLTIKFEFLH